MILRSGRAQCEAFVRHLIVPRSFVVSVQQDVRMTLDHSGHQRGSGQIDRRGARRIDTGRRARGLNPFALDYDHPTFVHRLAVEHAGRLQHDGGGVIVAAPPAALAEHCERGQDQKSKQKTLSHYAIITV